MTEKIALVKHDKSNWGSGPWQTEEDRIEWRHKGLPCLMVRNKLGAWCGYVGVTKEHPSFNAHYDKVDVDVHGGLTYSGKPDPIICHTPKPEEDGKVWWLGFDCSHAGDVSPALNAQLRELGSMVNRSLLNETYKDVAYVKREVNNLANQLIEVKK